MMKKTKSINVGITLPDDLFLRLKKYKEKIRESDQYFNLSKFVQDKLTEFLEGKIK
jgi:hypothetical protein